jgi:hypothetical protein
MKLTWNELYKEDISEHLDENPNQKDKNGNFLKYLSWNKCIMLLYKLGAEKVEFIPLFNDSGHSLFTYQHGAMIDKDANSKRTFDGYAPEVHVKVVVDDKEGIFSYPLINGIEVITMGKVNQQLINSARQRAFVKGVAQLTGLGLSLWEKEEPTTHRIDENVHSLPICVSRIMKEYAIAIKKNADEKNLAKNLGLSVAQLSNIMTVLKSVVAFEKRLVEVSK